MIPDFRNTYVKQPFEQIPIEVNFGSLTTLPKGAKEITLTSLAAKKWKRTYPDEVTDAPELLVSNTATILPPTKCKVRFHIQNGIDGFDYQVTLKVTFDNGAKLEEEVHVRVSER